MQRSSDHHLKEIVVIPKIDAIALLTVQNLLNKAVQTGSNNNNITNHPHHKENQNKRNPHLKRIQGWLDVMLIYIKSWLLKTYYMYIKFPHYFWN